MKEGVEAVREVLAQIEAGTLWPGWEMVELIARQERRKARAGKP